MTRNRHAGATGGTPAGVAILGSTGSIGTSALRVLARQRDRFVPVALTANGNVAALAEQVATWRPSFVGLVQSHADAPDGWAVGADCLVAAATHPDAHIVINAVVGAAGLPATAHGTVVQRLKLAEVSDAIIHSDPLRALAERMRLRAAITGAIAEGHAIIGFDRGAQEYLIGPLEA